MTGAVSAEGGRADQVAGVTTGQGSGQDIGQGIGQGLGQGLGQGDFLTLLVTQLKNQDPLNPLQNEAFVAQLAQFSTVSGITEMNASLKQMAESMGTEGWAAAPGWIGRSIETSDGMAGRVASVRFGADGSLALMLEDGAAVPLSAVTTLA